MKTKNHDDEVLKPIEKMENDGRLDNYANFVLDQSRSTGEFVISYVMSKTEERELYRCQSEEEAQRIWGIIYYAHHVGLRGYSPDEIRHPWFKPNSN